MSEHLPDTDVGNIEYIRKADAVDALQEKVFHNLTDEFYGAMQAIDELPSADVVQVETLKAEIYKLKCQQDSKNQDYYTGYMSALSTVEGILAGMEDTDG